MNDRSAASIGNHLRVAIRNALLLFPLMFFMGALTGWALAHVNRAGIGAAVGALIGVAFALWITRMYYATRGLLHHMGFQRGDAG
jgi:amino acid permease